MGIGGLRATTSWIVQHALVHPWRFLDNTELAGISCSSLPSAFCRHADRLDQRCDNATNRWQATATVVQRCTVRLPIGWLKNRLTGSVLPMFRTQVLIDTASKRSNLCRTLNQCCQWQKSIPIARAQMETFDPLFVKENRHLRRSIGPVQRAAVYSSFSIWLGS